MERERLRRRATTVLSGHLRHTTTALSDQMDAFHRDTTTTVAGRQVRLREYPAVVAGSADPAARAALAAGYRQLATAGRPLAQRLWAARYDAVRALGFASYHAAYGSLLGIDLDWLAGAARDTLALTGTAYRTGLRRYAGTDQPQWYDVAALMRGREWDSAFPATALADTAHRLATHLLDGPPGSAGVLLDLVDRPNKSSRPFCAAVRVPGQIHLVARPSGGHRDYEAVYHELGHALHFAAADPALAWELRLLPDDAVAETHAYALAAALRSPEHLRRWYGMTADAALRYREYADFLELFMVRRYCAKLLSELELHASGDPARADELLARWTAPAVGFCYEPGHALLDLDPGLYSAQYLMAWLMWGEWSPALADGGADSWVDSPAARARAAGAWRRCATDDPASFCAALGIDHPRPHRLAAALGALTDPPRPAGPGAAGGQPRPAGTGAAGGQPRPAGPGPRRAEGSRR